MKVLFDDQIFNMQKYGGISRYFAELLNAYKQLDGIDYGLAMQYSQNFYVDKYKLIDSSLLQRANHKFYNWAEGFKEFSSIIAAKKDRINTTYKENVFRKAKYDIFHPTYYNPYFLNSIVGKPLVITAHDMIHELFPEMYPLDDFKSQITPHWKSTLFSHADKIIAVSESTKRDIIRLSEVREEKITVVHQASSIRCLEKLPQRLAIPDNYILYVGERIRYKNFIPFIRAIAELLHKDNRLHVICAGGRAFTDLEAQIFSELSIQKQLLQFTVDDATLASLYGNALMLSFPSLYEGFGMPILEAFSCGCPVVLSDASSFPEVADDAALYFNPVDEGSMRNATEKVLYDKEFRSGLIKAGFKRVENFSWEKTAKETKAVYDTLV